MLSVGLQALVFSGKPGTQISLYKSTRRPSGPFSRCCRLLRKHVKTAFYNIHMYKYITYTGSIRHVDNRGKHENKINVNPQRSWNDAQNCSHVAEDDRENLPNRPFGTRWRLYSQVLGVGGGAKTWVVIQQQQHSHRSLGQRRLQVTSQCNGSLFLLRQMFVCFFKKNDASICAR